MRQVMRWKLSSILRISLALPALLMASVGRAQDTTRALSLGDAARLAAQRGAPVVIARYRTEAAEARVGQRRADLLPSLGASFADGERTYNTASFGIPFPGFDPRGSIIGPVRTVDVRARVAYNVFDPVAIARYRASQFSVDSTRSGEKAASDQSAIVAALAYVRALRANAQLGARAADSTSAAQLLSIARDQLSAGVGVALDVTRAESQLATVRAQLIAARNERDQAQLALRRALGLSATTPILLRDSLAVDMESLTPPSEQEALTIALQSRGEIHTATLNVESAERARSAASAARLPSVGLFADEGATSGGYSHLLQTYSYGVQLSVPVFEGRRIETRVEEQSAVLREAQFRLEDLRQQVQLDVASALLDITAAQEQLAAAAERVRLSETETAQARERFTAGVAGNADVISALLSLTGARTQLVDAQTALRSAWVSLARAEGRITSLP